MERASGILMPISSLPSKYGIGTLGREAREFADFLAAAGQRVWQMLPLGPTGYGDSPYSSFSTYAGNPYFIDLSLLAEDGLLDPAVPDSTDWGDEPSKVDYGKIYEHRLDVLRLAFEAGRERDSAAVAAFESKNSGWLADYALFMALKRHFDMLPWTEWPDEGIRLRKPASVARYASELAEDVSFFVYIQYLFYKQWDELRDYVHALGISVIGDLPIYVALDSADVWGLPSNFLLDEKNLPTEVSGVPPDYFCEDGQLWGNPIYNWEKMRADGYGWWIRRIEGAKKLYDSLRIDHFRGLESYWSVPYGAKTAVLGEWKKGPGMELVGVLKSWFPEVRFIAEDLGFMTPEVKKLLADSGFPGMKVLEFAFDPREPSNYLPHTYEHACVCYVGTHDNETLAEWLEAAEPESLAYATEYLGLNEAEGRAWGFIRGGMASVADLFVVQMQDFLGLGSEARTNIPGTSQGNWRWRLLPNQASPALAARLKLCTKMYGR
ncbi:MAG: 4-alpha-glucanotransferase [Oscillospiraceae bacterium]